MKRKIYVLGPSYCGSTLVSGLFNNIPGVFSPGELHWLVDGPPEMARCTIHGPGCPFIAEMLRESFAPMKLYQRAISVSGAETLVSTDKSTGHALRFLNCGEADGILLFKEPEALIASFKRHLPGLTFHAMLELYAATYENRFQFLRGGFFKKALVVRYDTISSNPDSLKRVCSLLDIESPTKPLSFPPWSWHNIGGNVSSYMDTRYSQSHVLPDERWRSELTGVEKMGILYDQRIRSIRSAMLQASSI